MNTSQQNVTIAAALTVQQAAQALGRLGGLAKSERKTAANRINARLGGRPKGSKTHKSASEVSNG